MDLCLADAPEQGGQLRQASRRMVRLKRIAAQGDICSASPSAPVSRPDAVLQRRGRDHADGAPWGAVNIEQAAALVIGATIKTTATGQPSRPDGDHAREVGSWHGMGAGAGDIARVQFCTS